LVLLAALCTQKTQKSHPGTQRPPYSQGYHRIIEWFGLEGTLKIIWFQPPCHKQGHLPLDQVAQSSIQPGLEHFQGGGTSGHI